MDSLDHSAHEGKSGVGVLDKSVRLLSFLASVGPASLAEVVEETGLSRPTAHRLLAALQAHHLVARREGRYALGLRLLAWGDLAETETGLVQAARPALVRLRDGTGESTQLYVREGDHRVCVAAVERVTGLKTTVAVGAVMPLNKGSAGKVLLAWAPDAERYGIEAAALTKIRMRGWAESVAEREQGVASVSAPVFGPDGSLRAAVSASGPISRLGEQPGERLSEAVVASAREIGASLGP